jgi:hypothetical protein
VWNWCTCVQPQYSVTMLYLTPHTLPGHPHTHSYAHQKKRKMHMCACTHTHTHACTNIEFEPECPQLLANDKKLKFTRVTFRTWNEWSQKIKVHPSLYTLLHLSPLTIICDLYKLNSLLRNLHHSSHLSCIQIFFLCVLFSNNCNYWSLSHSKEIMFQ